MKLHAGNPPPPLDGYLKINFDATYLEDATTTACVFQNIEGHIRCGWIN